MTSTAGSTAPQPPTPGDERRAATTEELRGLRRWVLVAGVWAVAATAIAVIALIDASDTDAQRRATDATDRAARAERSLSAQARRIDELETKLGDLPQTSDVSKLAARVSATEDDASKAAKDAKAASDDLKDLEDRVGALEDEAGGSGSGGAKGSP